MNVLVFHQAYEPMPLLVATVDAPDSLSVLDSLEFAFARTQNTEGSWSKGILPDGGPWVKRMAPLHTDEKGNEWGLRSTSVGDRMIAGSKIYEVAGCGFEEVEE